MKCIGIPKQDGFFWPAEFQPQQHVWLAWPERADNWRLGAKPAQQAFRDVIEVIAQSVNVSVAVNAGQYEYARYVLPDHVRVVELSTNDAWMRDFGPTVLINDQQEARAISWQFNAWGGLTNGLYFPWDKDDQVAEKISGLMGIDHYEAPFVMEGGAIHTDGEGTLYTTEECLLNVGRNPSLTKAQIESRLSDYLNISKVIWIPQGLYNDETNGHVDNLMHVIAPAEVVLSWCDDPEDPQYDISRAALDVLNSTEDAKGRGIKVHKLPVPGPLFLTEEEASSIEPSKGMKREAGERLSASYSNFLMINKTVVMPLLDETTDQRAMDVLKNALPDYQVIGVPGREILLGGGNIHCITQQIPALL
ncbi:agmatine deiminase [uncultured Endozoicomonas sp.]|uniref:agmatine deiminase n=1 Tax=uncultured Endozoicomonas sp. TaxID=432652 RepID=UPI00262BA3AD|nr:agmatine deiminase [uncultured Endozoicomonas sp.]